MLQVGDEYVFLCCRFMASMVVCCLILIMVCMSVTSMV